jgi:hypothetical protein
MINIDLRKENPVDVVNRTLAIESLVKYYPIDIVEEIDPRVVHGWTELDENDQDVPVKQINLAYCLFGLPTIEFHHLMEKLAKKVLKEEILPTDGTVIDDEALDRGKAIRDMIMRP